MDRIEAAIKNEQWDIVALYLLLGVIRTLDSLPPDSADALITMMIEGSEGKPLKDRPRWRRPGDPRRE